MRICYLILVFSNLKATFLSGDFEKCALEFVQVHFKEQLVYIYDGSFYIRNLGNSTRVNVNIGNCSYHMAPFYLLQSSNFGEVQHCLAQLHSSEFWSAQVKILFLNYASLQLEELFQIAWSFYLVDFVVLSRDLSLHTYTPISGGCSANKAVFVGRCGRSNRVIFEESQQRVFTGCNFTTAFIRMTPWQINWSEPEDPGLIPKVLNKTRLILDFNLQVQSNYNAFGIFEGSKYTEMLGDLNSGTIDFYTGSGTNLTYIRDFSYIPNYMECPYEFWVPVAFQKNYWKNLILVFKPQVWAALALTFSILALSCLLLKYTENGRYQNFLYCILSCWRTIFSINYDYPSSLQFKFVMLLWVCVSYLISSSYQGYMNTIMFLPHFDEQIDNVDKLLSSKLVRAGSYLVKDAYTNIGSESALKVAEDFYICPFNMYCTDRAAEERDFASIKDTRPVMYDWKRKYLDAEGKPKLFWFPSEAYVMIVTYLRKGHPVQNAMLDINMRILQSGLLQKWDKYNVLPVYTSKVTDYNRMRLEHLFLAFLLLTVGLIVATMLFTLEKCLPHANNANFVLYQ